MENLIGVITEPNTAVILCVVFILADIITGYLKAFKNKNINSSISRDGFIKKMGWFVGIALGYIINVITGMNVIVLLVTGVCMLTEFISVLENLSDIGVDLKEVKKYLDIKENKKEE